MDGWMDRRDAEDVLMRYRWPLSNDSCITHRPASSWNLIFGRMLMRLAMMFVDVKRQRISRHALNIALGLTQVGRMDGWMDGQLVVVREAPSGMEVNWK